MQWRNGRWVGVSHGGPGGVIDLDVVAQRHSSGETGQMERQRQGPEVRSRGAEGAQGLGAWADEPPPGAGVCGE